MKERPSRNPLLAEKTPRTVYQNTKWSYDPPQGQKAPDKWNYDSEEIGLVSQLGSMAERVKKEKAREDQYRQKIKQFEDQQQQLGVGNGTARGSSTGRLTGRQHQDSSRAGGDGNGDGNLSTIRTATETARSNDPYAHPSSSRGLLQPILEGGAMSTRGKTLSDFPVTSTKTLQASHPEILSKLRAERAAKYVESLAHPLDPPDYSHVSARVPFRPGGGSMRLQQARELPGGKRATGAGPGRGGGKGSSRSGGQREEPPLSTERMAESLKSLVRALEETDSEIARQDLKIALAKKVKTFEKKGPKPAVGTAR
jgi:hypothetical protein